MIVQKSLLAMMILIIILNGLVTAEEGGGQPGAFLRLPVGARSAGMGYAFSAVANDLSGIYYNPGGIFQIRGLAFGGDYSLMSLDRKHYLATLILSHPSAGAVGVSFMSFGISDIDGRDDTGNQTGFFDDQELALSLTYGRKLGSFLGLGGSWKYLHQSLASSSSKGFGYDLGLLARFDFKRGLFNSVRFGASMTNLSASLKWDTLSELEESIPMTTRLGMAMDVNMGRSNLLLAIDYESTENMEHNLHAGGEFWWLQVIGLRGGVSDHEVHLGVSIRVSVIEFDFAYCPDALGEGATNKIGIQLLAPEHYDRSIGRHWQW